MSHYLDRLQQFPEFDSNTLSWEGAPAGEDMAQHRHRHWGRYADDNNLQPVEFLIPRLNCDCPDTEPRFIQDLADHADQPATVIANEVDALSPWGFYFRFIDGITTETPEERNRESRSSWLPWKRVVQKQSTPRFTRNRTLCRSHLITDTVTRLLGDRLPDTRILDLGTNCGFFSFDIAHHGARQVTGLEMRDDNLARARFLQSYYKMPNVEFAQGDVMNWQPSQPYEVVYNLGLLYHVVDPIGLLQRTYDWCTDFAVVDTVCHRYPFSAFIPRFEKDTSRPGEGRYDIELHPTYRALIDSMYYVGFRQLVELVAVSGRVSGLYRDHVRRCIIGFK